MPVDFAALLTAVRPKERTDQYVIIAALFAKGAAGEDVSAREITDLLKLHLRANAPKNVNGSLRKYSTYVSPIDDLSPLRWRLTEKGIDRLRALSGLSLSTAEDAKLFDSDVGIICALEHPELSAVIDAFGKRSDWRELEDARHTHVYRETKITTVNNHNLRVIATTSTSMGLTAAAIVSTQLIMRYRPRLVVMTGIAAGTRSGGKKFGDILVADPSIDYASGKVIANKGIRDFQPDPYPIGLNPRVRSLLLKYRNAPDIFEEIRGKWKGPLPEGPNRVHVGPVGAADQVVDDASRMLEIVKNWRKLIGVEMETYGVYRAVNESPEPKPRVVSFKSVCDFAAEKSDSWQAYAAFTAATFAYEFIRREWEALWPEYGKGEK